MYLLGGLVGGVVGMYLFSSLFEWLIFRRLFGDGEATIAVSVVAAFVLGVGVYSFGNGDTLYAGMVYGIGGAIVGILKVGSFRRREETAEDHSDLRETFE